ncbi:MAG TPA: adenylate/guanylate cyclase domain-containing protein [Thiotrichales bacterium]|nr:adenylate/guanylate cyclase domain-containing protein [Thiotrichales bacterium]
MLFRRLTGHPYLMALAIPLLVAALVMGARASGLLQKPELAFRDHLLANQKEQTNPPTVAIVAVTEQDIQRLGTWPLPDRLLARLLESIDREGAAAIGLDIYRDLPVGEGSERLEREMRENPRVIGVTLFADDPFNRIAPPRGLQGTDRIAANDVLLDPDGVVRRGLLFLDDGTTVFPALGLRLATLFLAERQIFPLPDPVEPGWLRLGRTTFPPLDSHFGGYTGIDDRGYQFPMDFRLPPERIPRYTITQVLDGTLPAGALKGRIVLVGVISTSVKDRFQTPLGGVSGVTLHALHADQLVRSALTGHALPSSWSQSEESLWILLWALLGGVLASWSRTPVWFALSNGAGLLVLYGFAHLGLEQGVWIVGIAPALAMALSAALFTAWMVTRFNRERRMLMNLFSRHVSDEVAHHLWEHREEFIEGGRLQPQLLNATTLFADIREFTPVAERLSPRELLEWLNLYLEMVARKVLDYGGMVDDYYGDAIKANFGVPIPRMTTAEMREDAVRAISCALAVREALRDLNARQMARGAPAVQVRVGIYSGPVVAGSLGSERRLKYTTVGDTVNSAARLESFDSASWLWDDADEDCRILVGEPTVELVGDRFRLEFVAERRVKGKQQPLRIYRVLGHANESRQEPASSPGAPPQTRTGC